MLSDRLHNALGHALGSPAAEEVLAAFVHDLRNPLSALYLEAHLLKARGGGDDPELTDAFERLVEEAERLRGLMERVDSAMSGKQPA